MTVCYMNAFFQNDFVTVVVYFKGFMFVKNHI